MTDSFARPRQPIDPERLVREVNETIARHGWEQDPGRGVEDVVYRVVLPEYTEDDLELMAPLVGARHSSPYVTLALVIAYGMKKIDLLTVFSKEELVEGAYSYLVSRYSFEFDWAWYAIWNGPLAPGDHFDVVMALLEHGPLDDDQLWMIGDGPVGELQMLPGGTARVEQLAQSNERLAKVLQLVDEIP